MSILIFLIIILAFIVLIGILNEKAFHIQSDIALIMFSLIIALIMAVLSKLTSIAWLDVFVNRIGDFGFEEYLLDGVLCFMLFAGASKVNISFIARRAVRLYSCIFACALECAAGQIS